MEFHTLTLQMGKLRPREKFTEQGGCDLSKLEARPPLRGLVLDGPQAEASCGREGLLCVGFGGLVGSLGF